MGTFGDVSVKLRLLDFNVMAYHILVCLHVGSIVAGCREPLPALLALEGLLTSMDLLVPFEVRYLKVSDVVMRGPVPV